MVTACAGRTVAIRDAERDIHLHGLVAVQVGARARLTCEQVHRDVLRQLRIPGHQLAVKKMKEATFLLCFVQPAQRNTALGRGLLDAGRTRLHLMSWTRQLGAEGASKIPYRVRVCVEGVPKHAEHLEVISQLFPPDAIIDRIDQEKTSDDEESCLCVWLTVFDPNATAVEGKLKIEEPVEFTEEEHNDLFTRLGNMELPEVRPGAAKTVDFKVLLHIDQVVDFTSPPSSPSWKSYESDISGIPSDSPDVECPVKHVFSWRLGVPDRLRSP